MSLTLSRNMSYDNNGFTRSEKKVGYLGYVGYFSTKIWKEGAVLGDWT
jgi:hypothetical protein